MKQHILYQVIYWTGVLLLVLGIVLKGVSIMPAATGEVVIGRGIIPASYFITSTLADTNK